MRPPWCNYLLSPSSPLAWDNKRQDIMNQHFSDFQSMDVLSSKSNQSHLNANDRAIVELFDAYTQQGIDRDNARTFVRACLGLSKNVVMATLARARRE